MSTDVKRSRIIVNLSRLSLNNDRSIDRNRPPWSNSGIVEGGGGIDGPRLRGADINLPITGAREPPIRGYAPRTRFFVSGYCAAHRLSLPFRTSTPFSKTWYRQSSTSAFRNIFRGEIFIYMCVCVYWKTNRFDRWKNDKIIRNNLHPIRNNCAIVSLPSITDYRCLLSVPQLNFGRAFFLYFSRCVANTKSRNCRVKRTRLRLNRGEEDLDFFPPFFFRCKYIRHVKKDNNGELRGWREETNSP